MTASLARTSLMSALVVIALGSLDAHAERFYLTSERVFAPGEPASVKLEANGVEVVDLRVYRLEDPRAWFDAQRDLHRPAVEHAAPRPSSVALLKRGARHGLERLLVDVRKRFAADGRTVMKAAMQDIHQAAVEGPTAVVGEEVLPPLAAHPLVDAWRISLPEQGGWLFDDIAVPVRDPGAYLVEAVAGAQVAYAVLLISSVALVTKQSSKTLLVWAVDPATGAPRPGTRVSVLDGGKQIDDANTDGDGLARFSLGLRHTPVLYAENGASFTLLDPRFYSANLEEPRVYVFTERPVYRPGQEVFVKGFAREMDGERYVLPRAGTSVTLTVVDPEGTAHDELSLTMSERGSFDGRFILPPDVAMGTWQVVALIDGKRYGGQFKVMSYVKPEVRLTVRLDDQVARAGDAVAGVVDGAYFFGAPYRDVEVKLTLTRTRFFVPWYVDADYAWYFAESEYQNTRREVLSEWTCRLDERGMCPFEIATKDDSQDFTYVVEAVALDPTGRAVSGQGTLTVTHGAFRLAFEQGALIKKPGTREQLVVTAEDHGRRPVVGARVDVLVRARHATREGTPETVEVLRETRTTDENGRIAIDVELARGGYYEVRASALDDKKAEIVAETFVFASEGAGELPFAPPDIEIVTDKKSYFAGERALVLVLAPAPSAHVLFSVEGGDLYRADVLAANNHAALVSVDIGEAQTPNFYLSAATVVGGKVFTKQRSVVVPPREKLLVVEVSPDRTEAKPGERVEFVVNAATHDGKPAKDVEVALAVVDEAIYAVSPEIAVPLEAFFHPRKRNDVRTEESVSFRFFGTSRGTRDKAARDALARPFSFGSMKPQLDDVRKVFKDTAGFFPSLVTDESGRARASVTLPDNLTSWRATARAISREAAVGSATAAVRVKKPLVVRVALPSHFVEGDEGHGALVLQNLTDAPLTVDASVEATGADGASLVLTPDDGAWPRRVDVPARASTRVPLAFAASRAGPIVLRARAAAGALVDELETPLAIEPWRSLARVSESGVVGGEVSRVGRALSLPAGVTLAEAVVELELMPSALATIRHVLPSLVEFPYGCTEQTMSRFLPALAARAAAKRLGVSLDDVTKDLDAVVAAGRDRLAYLQHDDGGFGWWREDATDVFMTAWVIEGLVEAKALGADVDDERVARAADAVLAILPRVRLALSDEARAFALYALARAGKPQPSMVSELASGVLAGRAHLVTAALLALAAHAGGDAARAAELAGRVAEGALAASLVVDGLATDDERVVRAEHHPVEVAAWSALALHATKVRPDVLSSLEHALLAHVDGARIGTTRQTALVVRALATTLSGAEAATSSVEVFVAGQPIESARFDAATRGQVVRRRMPMSLAKSTVPFLVRGEGAPVAWSLSVRAPQVARELKADGAKGFAVKRTVYALSGSAGAWSRGAPAASSSTGDTLLIELELTSPRELAWVMIEDPRPAGVTAIERDGTLLVDDVDLRIAGAHREHRDTKTTFFLSRVGPGRTRLSYLARAGLPGTYRALPALASAMYTPSSAHARSSSSILEIRAP